MADRCDWIVQSGDFYPIKTANGGELVIDGKATVPIRVSGRSTEVDVLVTPDITGLILGELDGTTRPSYLGFPEQPN